MKVICGVEEEVKVICGSDGKGMEVCGVEEEGMEGMEVADTIQKQQESAVDRMDADSVGEVTEVAV